MTTMNQSPRSPIWRIHWPEIEPTLIRYQEAVTLDRVLSEHRAAVGAEPIALAALRGSSWHLACKGTQRRGFSLVKTYL